MTSENARGEHDATNINGSTAAKKIIITRFTYVRNKIYKHSIIHIFFFFTR